MKRNPFKKKENLRTLYVFGPDGRVIGKPLKESSPKLEAWIDSYPDPKDTSRWIKVLCVGYRHGGKKYFDINEHGMAELPADDPGSFNGVFTFDGYIVYKTYGRNDKGLKDQWGKAEHIAGLINVVIEYRETYPDDILDIGDMRSPKNDGVPNSSPTNLHHKNFGAIDIRPLGKNGSFQGDFTDPRHDVGRSKAFIKAMGNHGYTTAIVGKKVIDILKEASNEKITVITDKGVSVHHDHYHFHIKK
jgi:hypothetical protein